LRNDTSSTYTKMIVSTARTSLATTARSSPSEPEKSTDHDGDVSWPSSQPSTLSPCTWSPSQSETHWFPKTTMSTAAVTVPVNERDGVMGPTVRPDPGAQYHTSVYRRCPKRCGSSHRYGGSRRHRPAARSGQRGRGRPGPPQWTAWRRVGLATPYGRT